MNRDLHEILVLIVYVSDHGQDIEKLPDHSMRGSRKFCQRGSNSDSPAFCDFTGGGGGSGPPDPLPSGDAHAFPARTHTV